MSTTPSAPQSRITTAKYEPGHYDGDGCTFPDPGHFAKTAEQILDELIELDDEFGMESVDVQWVSEQAKRVRGLIASRPAAPPVSDTTAATITREALADALMRVYDHGASPNALREADFILAALGLTVTDETGPSA